MFDGSEPIYLQIAEHLRRGILDGTMPEGAQVMSTTQFATTFGINPATAAKAFAILVEEQLIYKQRGLGMFVSAGAQEKLRDEYRSRYLSEVFEPALARARALGIPSSELMRHLKEFMTQELTQQESTQAPAEQDQP